MTVRLYRDPHPQVPDVVGRGFTTFECPREDRRDFQRRLKAFLENCETKECDEGDVLIRQSTNTPTLYFLLNGRVSIERMPIPSAQDDSARPTIVRYGRPGQLFGEMLLLGEDTHTATVTAVETCTLLDLNPQMKPGAPDFTAFADSAENNMWRRICCGLADKIRDNNQHLALVHRQNIASRLAYNLLQLMKDNPHENDDNIIRFPLSGPTLARHITADERSVQRHLKSLIDNNIVAREGNLIAIRDAEALQRYGDSGGKVWQTDDTERLSEAKALLLPVGPA